MLWKQEKQTEIQVGYLMRMAVCMKAAGTQPDIWEMFIRLTIKGLTGLKTSSKRPDGKSSTGPKGGSQVLLHCWKQKKLYIV